MSRKVNVSKNCIAIICTVCKQIVHNPNSLIKYFSQTSPLRDFQYIAFYSEDKVPFRQAHVNGKIYTRSNSSTKERGYYGSFRSYLRQAEPNKKMIGMKKATFENASDLYAEGMILRSIWGNKKIYHLHNKSEGKAYLTMPYCRGKTLEKYVPILVEQSKQSGGTLFFLKELFRIMYSVGLIVDYIHQKKYAHNDIHEGNIIVDVNGKEYTVYLIDYGRSRKFGDPIPGLYYYDYDSNHIPPEFRVKDLNSSLKVNSNADVFGIGSTFMRQIALFFLKKDDWHAPLFELLKNVCSKNDPVLKKFSHCCSGIVNSCCLKPNQNDRIKLQDLNDMLFRILREFQASILTPAEYIPMGIKVNHPV